MAAAAKMAAAQFNTDKHTIFSNHIVALCGDGCMQARKYAHARILYSDHFWSHEILHVDASIYPPSVRSLIHTAEEGLRPLPMQYPRAISACCSWRDMQQLYVWQGDGQFRPPTP